MEKLKQLIELAKTEYEKIVLVVAVLGLAFAVVLLYWLSGEEQRKANDITMNYERKKVKPPPELNLQRYSDALAAATTPPSVSFGLPHKLFNPVKWIRSPEGRVIADRSGKAVGPEAVKVENIRPLNRVFRWLATEAAAGEAGASYSVEIVFEASPRSVDARPRVVNFKKDDKSRIPGASVKTPNYLWLKEVRGAADAPDALVLEITETKEEMVITKEKPSVKPEAFQVDLSYAPENLQFRGQRRDGVIGFGGEQYKIVEITENEVVVSNRLNDKKTRLKRTP